jgi:hypothetical protein
MQSKLTLRLEEELIARAKVWARRRGVSLSQLVATVFEQLPRSPAPRLSPWTRKLRGLARGRGRPASDRAIQRGRLDRLAEKHQ